ncbi:MAG: phosphate ABC transporter substrate-binding protein PstS, partial [Actinomycetota bacterium]|nr:phosphate ABC transporter substrate-binding protein PstS [Actinomycetota bacterium]
MAVVAFSCPASPAIAGEQVNGSGSTWSSIAVQQWQADVAKQGISINFNANGSSTGRKFYIQGQSDFAVSEIPFQPQAKDRAGTVLYDEIAQAARRPYAYMPIVAGGTSFMYHLTVNGRMVTDLRLSGATIAKIFTGVIKNWNDPAIAADDGRSFPSEQIKPVVRSDGSGTSAQFTAYLANQFPDIWRSFCAKSGLAPCPAQTSLYPYFAGSQAQQLSDGVASAVAAPYNEGAITYVEYGYAKQRSFPVVSVKNRAGYFVQPTAGNVAVALTTARINPDRTQVLDGVYTNPDKRAYPVSSYSYMIVPTTTAQPFTTGKGATLGQFILYFLCTGQQKAEQLGYSPLPENLVQFGFDAERRIPGAPAPPPINQCANPTITGTFSPQKAPQPPPDAAPSAVRPSLGGTGNGSGGGTAVAGGRVGTGGGTANAQSANTGGGSSGT